MSEAAYQPSDTLYLWWLADPAQPRWIGTLRSARAQRGVSLHYSPEWLAQGVALSEDLPLRDLEFLPTERDSAAGAVDDARPDRWGERVIRLLDKPARLSLMEYLYYAGDARFGALGVSTSAQHYQPRRPGPLPVLADVGALQQLVQRVLNGDSIPPEQRRLIAPGTTLGGARPKALLDMDDAAWVLKFGEPGDDFDSAQVEHACMTLAAHAGIRVAPTRVIPLPTGHAIAVRRFDRQGPRRRHALSAHVALRACGEVMGYPELAQLLRRRGVVAAGQHLAQMRELFRRMVFNILIDNTDDHEKNHALLLTDAGDYELAPAYDVLPACQSLGYQQMRVGTAQSDATLDNALSEHTLFGLSAPQAQADIRAVCAVVQGWAQHFADSGVSPADIATLAAAIDRPFLSDQRQAWV